MNRSKLQLDLDSSATWIRQSWGQRHALCLSFSYPYDENSEELIAGRACLLRGPIELSYDFVCVGYDLKEFANRLARLHANLDGIASFIPEDGCIEVLLQVVDRGIGLIGVTLSIEEHVTSVIDEELIHQRIKFDGFGIDQSYLPGLGAQLRTFLSDNAISTRHPMLGA